MTLQLYSVFHLNIAYSSIEDEQRPEVIRRCYWPLLRLAREFNLPFGIEAIDPSFISPNRRLAQRKKKFQRYAHGELDLDDYIE